jgi:hypothetical protein
MAKRNMLITLILLILFSMGTRAQEFDLEKHPGYIDLEKIEIPDKAGRVTDISLGPAFVKFVKWANGEDAEEDLRHFSGILSIRVKVFEVDDEDTETIRRIMNEYAKKMEAKEWENMVLMKHEDERFEVRVKFDGKRAIGFFMMAHEPGDEVAFVNIVGDDIDFKNFGCFKKRHFGFDWDWF